MKMMYIIVAALFFVGCTKTEKEDVANIQLVDGVKTENVIQPPAIDSIKDGEVIEQAEPHKTQEVKEEYKTTKGGSFSVVGKTTIVDYSNKQVIEGQVNKLWEYLYANDFSSELSTLQNDKNIYVVYSNYDQPKGKMSITIGYRVTEIKTIPTGLNAKALPAKEFLTYQISGQASDYLGEGWNKLEEFMASRDKNAYDFEVYTLTEDYSTVKAARLWVSTK